ncbi:hypothetical protein MJO29_006148 [Puccinia striiformis f. sp. tritici]|nr:hypothetical protein Pst134EA_011368 [Puccinia striiformis f. sp. tritici]KAI9604963.1 hypothetical protein H4Q26_002933 [Puccinia striiformis f. sp. tritici PST-130]POW03285.1 hypothetical protein PSTT_11216 [Puccinia striiformis]KAH9456130.1 hypothetical protein Pst134EB_012335 [Puccinia striiformis f. sp. tritici]KAH9467737.1 hypothetical protein Pst134EA_011368 [Puccinia striiformis f. sp. tritici]KAI7957931.1 hypothetical protein MJO29_006148 [Puccinia striiformis f. sp. tritici]
MSHIQLCSNISSELEEHISNKKEIVLGGYDLTPAGVVGAARYDVPAKISDDPVMIRKIEKSVSFLESKLNTAIYGVTTGFGASADTRSDSTTDLQMAFLEHQLSGVLPLGSPSSPAGSYLSDPMSNVMPEAITRGAILIRINSLVRGHSALRLTVLETLATLLEKKLIPMVPLRGSISASGDLMPLSYVAGAICGHPAIRILDRSSADGHVEVLPALDALKKHGITPIVLRAKEGLAICNGTAFSTSAACLVAHDSHMLLMLAQVLTSMTVEAMMGQAQSFDPFIHETCRPHPGQVEVAKNIRSMFEGSRLVTHLDEERSVDQEKDQAILRQDRYALRTAPQWLGPQLEELISVNKTLSQEINATTDNPLIDIENNQILNGGNFQAMSVTNAMEKTRSSLESIGKLSFAQASELMNCSMNKGLPSCLAGDEPSTNYHTKGLEINMAAYTAELGYLASPVSTHVQSAEQHNQSVNSLALVSARYTIQAAEVLSMQLSAHLYVVCMAIDLRVIDQLFKKELQGLLPVWLDSHFKCRPTQAADSLMSALAPRLEASASLDSEARFLNAFKQTSHILLAYPVDLPEARSWPTFAASQATLAYKRNRDGYFDKAGSLLAEEWLGNKGKNLYRFVRKELGIGPRRGDVRLGKHQGSVTLDVSKIYESVRSGELYKFMNI